MLIKSPIHRIAQKLILLFILFLPFNLQAQVTSSYGVVSSSLSTASAGAVTGTSFALPLTYSATITWVVVADGSAISVNLEGSLDNSIWFTVDSITTPATGAIRNFGFTSLRFLRISQASRTGGTATTGTFTVSRGYINGSNSTVVGGVNLPNNVYITGRNLANTANINMFRIGTGNTIEAGTTIDASVINTSATITSTGLITGTAGLSVGAASFISIATRGFWQASANGIWELLRADGTFGVHYEFAAVPVIGACGTSPSISTDATNVSGTITVGSANPASCLLTFNGTWNKAPRCVVNTVTTTAADVRAVATSTSTTVLTVTPASAFATTTSLVYHCESSK